MDQLQALDTLFLGLETENVQANIGGVSILDGPPPTLDELKQQALGALELLPRYRQRIRELPTGLGKPLWIDDEAFDIDNHLIQVDLGSDVERDEITDFFANVMSQRLDRSRPLWLIHIIGGLPGGQWAILWTVHHAMVDGIAATDLMALLLSFDPKALALKPSPWTPRAEPPTFGAVRESLGGQAGVKKPFVDASRALRQPRKLAQLAGATARGLIPAGRAMFNSNDCPLNGPIGPDRIWRVAQLDLKKVKLAGTLHGGTVNDVVLAVVTGGLREFLISEEADLDKCTPRTMVPVSIRSEDQQGELANHVSAVFVDMPVASEDPVEALRLVREQMDEIKRIHGETTAEVLGEVANYVPHAIFEAGERTIVRLADVGRFFNTVTTNVPGPQAPLYCLGREMRALYPYVMLMKDLRISTAIFSYNGTVHFGVTGDKASEPDIQSICSGVEQSLEALLDASPAMHPN